ncbi:MAG: PhoH-like ATPase [Thermotogaceae bacterium]|nr:PhoH-like ATPase [Thermotogaceae bacterium]MDN5337970.1 PhoH-like ATPase [Thermotogaceae bacterium]
MIKNYILDTNVLIHDPNSIFSFEDNNVIIPLPVIEEIDKLKKNSGEVGKNAREVARILDNLRTKGKISEGIKLENGGTLKILLLEDSGEKVPRFLSDTYKDNWIIEYSLKIMKNSKIPTILVSKDINLRIKAEVLGIPAQDYLRDKVDPTEIFSGCTEIKNKPHLSERLKNGESIPVSELGLENLRPNEFVDIDGVYGRYIKSLEKIVPIKYSFKSQWWGISPRNREQLLAFELLMDDSVKLVTLIGPAGTGKTLLSITAGLVKVIDQKLYKKLVVTKPIVPVGKEIGFLPGDVEEKMLPWVQPIFDNLEFLFGSKDFSPRDFLKKGVVEVVALSLLRGRSIPDQFIIIDEAQNLTPHEVKTIITRVGENSKIILTGDPSQIDNPYLDSMSNGLVYVAKRFYNEPISGHLSLVKGERSELASRAIELL